MKTIIHFLFAAAIIGGITSCSKTEISNLTPVAEKNTVLYKPEVLKDNAQHTPVGLQIIQVYYNWHAFNFFIQKTIDEPVVFRTPEKREPMELYTYNTAQVEQSTGESLMPISSSIEDAGQTILLREIQITFNPGFTPRQFYSREDIYQATTGPRPEIGLETTGSVYEARLANFGPHSTVPLKPDPTSSK